MLPLDFQETSTLKLSKDDASVEFQRWISYSKYESIQKLIDVIDSIRNVKWNQYAYSMKSLSNK